MLTIPINDDSDGKAGFSFTRLNSDGSEYSGERRLQRTTLGLCSR